MNGLDFLDLVIGLIFIYLIYSIACSALCEIIVGIALSRGSMLFKWIMDNFGLTDSSDTPLGEKILHHPLIKGISFKSKKKPAYISSAIFTDVLLDLIVNNESKEDSSNTSYADINSLKKRIEQTTIIDPGLKRVFLQYISEASGDISSVKAKISKWYDEAQERLIGSYKKNLQVWVLGISAVLVIGTNADTFNLASYLYNNDDARETIANKATLFVQDSAIVNLVKNIDNNVTDTTSKIDKAKLLATANRNIKTLDTLYSELKENSIPVGWNNEKAPINPLKKVGGLLLSILAISMGAPFWFDILSKLANLRSSGSKPKTSAENTDLKEIKKLLKNND